jgi:hypothetical protein
MIQAKDHVGWVYWKGHGDKDGYFRSVAELIEWCADQEIALPQFVKACRAFGLELDAEYIIDCALENHHEDAGENITDAERAELQKLLDEWSKRTGVISYEETNDEIILWTLTDGKIEDLTE